MTTLDDFGGVLGRPLDTFFWALTISWSRLLAGVCHHFIIITTLCLRGVPYLLDVETSDFFFKRNGSLLFQNKWFSTLALGPSIG